MEEAKPRNGNIEDTMEEARFAKDGTLLTPGTPEEEAAVIRKLDWRILPLVLLVYTFSNLDRSNLGNAKLAGLGDSVDLSGRRYDWLATAFYIAYICSQWTAVGFKRFPAHIWVAVVTMAWSTVSSLQASVQNYAGLIVLRILLGVFEAMFAGVPFYLSFFYPRHKLGLRTGIFLSGSALANAYGGALAYAITGIRGAIEPWRILFLIEGLPTWLVAAAAYFFLPDNLASTKFLNEREKEIAYSFVSRGQDFDPTQDVKITWSEWRMAFLDYKSYIPGLMYFACNVCFGSLPLFVPTIVSEMGDFTEQQSNGLSAPPYLLTFIVIILCSLLSDHLRLRGPFVCIPAILSCVGYILLATQTEVAPRYAGVFFSILIFVSISILLPWVATVHSTESKRAGGWAIFATLGQLGPLVGTNIFPKDQGPYYAKGAWISCGFVIIVATLSATFSMLLRWENKRLDRNFRTREGTEGGGERGFRYIL